MSAQAHATIDGEFPTGPQILAAYEAEAAEAAGRVADRTAARAQALFPGTRTRSKIRGTVTRTGAGLAITVRVHGGREYIARFVEAGTGEEGPRRRKIPRARRGRLPSGAVPTGRGQKPQRVFERVRAAEADAALRELEDAADTAARRLFR